MDKVVHFEIPVDDAARAREFYGSAFEWDLNEMDMGGGNMYTTVTTTPIDEATRQPTEPGGINGGLMQRTARHPDPGGHDRRRLDRRDAEEGRGGRRQHGAAAHRDPGHGRLRLLQGQREQRGRVVGELLDPLTERRLLLAEPRSIAHQHAAVELVRLAPRLDLLRVIRR